MKKFKIGDIVRARKMDNGEEAYTYTNSLVRCRVVGVGVENIRVEILDGYYKGDRYTVDGEDFYPAWRNTPAFRHGDISQTLFPRKQQ